MSPSIGGTTARHRWYERILSGIIGVLLLGLYGALPSPWRYLTLSGVVFLATAWTGWSPTSAWRRHRRDATES